MEEDLRLGAWLLRHLVPKEDIFIERPTQSSTYLSCVIYTLLSLVELALMPLDLSHSIFAKHIDYVRPSFPHTRTRAMSQCGHCIACLFISLLIWCKGAEGERENARERAHSSSVARDFRKFQECSFCRRRPWPPLQSATSAHAHRRLGKDCIVCAKSSSSAAAVASEWPRQKLQRDAGDICTRKSGTGPSEKDEKKKKGTKGGQIRFDDARDEARGARLLGATGLWQP